MDQETVSKEDPYSCCWVHWGLAAYLVMFYFGSVARYRPTHLNKILQGKYAWDIEEFFATQPRQFLYLVANCLLKQEVVRPMALL
jgi:YaaC-like Protein